MRLPKKKAVKAAVAGLAASAMLLTAMPAYAASVPVAAESTASPTSDDLTASPLVDSVSPFRAVPRTPWDGPFLSPDVSGYAENL